MTRCAVLLLRFGALGALVWAGFLILYVSAHWLPAQTLVNLRDQSRLGLTAGLGLDLKGQVMSGDFGVLAGLQMANTFSGNNDFSLGHLRLPVGAGLPKPEECDGLSNVGRLFARLDAKASGATVYVCAQTGSGVYSWEPLQAAAPVASIERKEARGLALLQYTLPSGVVVDIVGVPATAEQIADPQWVAVPLAGN